MAHLLQSTGLQCLCRKAAVSRRNEELFLSNQLESPTPCLISCRSLHRRNGPLLFSSNGYTCKKPLLTVNYKPISSAVTNPGQKQVNSPIFASIGTKAGLNFFRKKRPHKQPKNLQSIVIRSVLYFAAKQNFLFDFLLNNWSEYNRIVLNSDDDGGQGGGFPFIRGFGGDGEENFPRKRRKACLRWWWVLSGTAIVSLIVLSVIYYGNLKLPPNLFDEKRLKGLIKQAGSFESFTLLTIVIVGVASLTGSTLVGSLKFLRKNSKVTIFPPTRTRNLLLSKSFAAGTLLSTVGLGMLYPTIAKAIGEEICSYAEQLKQTTDSQMRAAQKKISAMFNTMTNRGSKARNKRKGRSF